MNRFTEHRATGVGPGLPVPRVISLNYAASSNRGHLSGAAGWGAALLGGEG